MGEGEERAIDTTGQSSGSEQDGQSSVHQQPPPHRYVRLVAPLPEDIEIPELAAPSSHEPEPMEEPTVPSNINPAIPIPEHQQQLYRPMNPETFAQQRARVERQGTLLFKSPPLTSSPTTMEPKTFGPVCHAEPRETPYSNNLSMMTPST